jgi:gliding motility-associated-like protein
LQVLPGDPSLFGMYIVQDVLCQPGAIDVQFVLPAPGIYTYNYTLSCSNGTQSNSITTASNPISLNVTDNCTLQVNSITNIQTGCTTEFNPALTDDIVINNPPQIQVFNMQICQGQSINIADYVFTEIGATLTFHSNLPANTSNQLPSSFVSPAFTTIYYAKAILNGCEATTPVQVFVLPGGVPFNSTASVCENANPVNLSVYVVPSSLSGIWSGTGVSGNFFNPQGLSGVINLVFTPDDGCYLQGVLNVNIQPDLALTLQTADICGSDSPLNLNTLREPPLVNGNWSGTGVNNNFFIPSNSGAGIFTLSFTPSNVCISPVSTTVNVFGVPVPDIQSNIIVCQSASINLADFINNSSNTNVQFYYNLPAIPANEILNSNLTIFSTSQFYVKITDANGCFGIAPLLISTTPGGIPNLGTATVCQSQNTFNLNVLNDPFAGGGNWTGPGVFNNILDLNANSGSINVTFTPLNDCFQIAQTSVNVVIPPTPVLQSQQLCSGSGNFNLIALIDPNFPAGVWSGPGVTNNIFNPQGLSGAVQLLFDPDGFCINNGFTTVDVKQTTTPVLNASSICETTTFVNLDLLLDPQYHSGTWSGPGITGNIFLSTGLPGINSLTFTSSEECVLPSATSITVLVQQTPQPVSFSVCQNSDPIDLNTKADPAFTSGIWTGAGVNNNIFSPNGLSGQISLSFASDASCTLPATLTTTVYTSPIVSNITATCDKITNQFIVSFIINGGDTTTYTVNGIRAGSNFSSDLFNSESNYFFSIKDTNQCLIATVQGIKNCACQTSAGNMNFTNAPIAACYSGVATAIYEQDQILDDNDGLFFVLHDNNGPSLGNILAISKQPSFTFPPGGVPGVTYYISSVVGDTINGQLIDIKDNCLSVSAGVPVIFYQPSLQLSQISDICITDCAEVTIGFTGQSPYNLISELSQGIRIVSTDTLVILNNLYQKIICPQSVGYSPGKYNFKIIGYSDKNCTVPDIGNSGTFEIYPERNIIIRQSICAGDSLIVNGRTYNQGKLKGTEIIKSFKAGQCDSIITVDLNLVQPSVYFLNKELCKSQSLTINGTVYDVNHPSGQELLQRSNRYGCDSIIKVNLTFTDEINVTYNPVLCKGSTVVVNGNIYNENKPSGIERIPSIDGMKCDSVIFVQLVYKDLSAFNYTGTFCNNETIYVNNQVYNKDKPKGKEIIPAGAVNGCDSIINVNFTFYPASIGTITDTLCQTESIVINGITYSKDNPTGTITIVKGSKNGCDSILNVNLYFFPVKTDTILVLPPDGDSVVINGVTFTKKNNIALTINPQQTIQGCLSYSYIIVQFPPDIISTNISVSPETCPGENDGIFILSAIKGCRNQIVKFKDLVYRDPALPLVFNGLSPGKYELTIEGDEGCFYTESIIIKSSRSEQFVIIKDLFSVEKGTVTEINPGISPRPAIIKWSPSTFLSCSDCIVPILSDSAVSTQYILTLTNADGCTFSYNIRLEIREKLTSIVFPNIFTPNGDGKNDSWKVLFTKSEKINQLNIYDRWGNKVYEIISEPSIDYISWEGNMGSIPVESGVYIYMAQIKNFNGQITYKTGDITLMR